MPRSSVLICRFYPDMQGRTNPNVTCEASMTTFDKREEGFEKKFAHDEELRFKASARRNKLFGLWAAEKLGLTGDAANAYAKDVVMADFEEAGDNDVLKKVQQGSRGERYRPVRTGPPPLHERPDGKGNRRDQGERLRRRSSLASSPRRRGPMNTTEAIEAAPCRRARRATVTRLGFRARASATTSCGHGPPPSRGRRAACVVAAANRSSTPATSRTASASATLTTR